MALFPDRLIMMSGHYQDRSEDESIARFLTSHGAELVEIPEKKLQRGQFIIRETDLPVGPISFISAAYRSRTGQRIPEHNDYPPEFSDLLHRRVWEGVFRDRKPPVFVKPRGNLKRFVGQILPDTRYLDNRCASDLLLSGSGRVGENIPVWFSEVIPDIHGEFRVFVADGEIYGIRPQPFQEHSPEIDEHRVSEIVSHLPTDFCAAVDLATGFGNQIVLVETNPPYAVGSYGLETEKYFQFLWSGWKYLCKQLRG